MLLFQSALPRGERLDLIHCMMQMQKFQSALPRGERRFDTPVGLHFQPFQSALPRGERRRYFVNTFLYLEISIRAPARGATIFLLQIFKEV